MTLSLEHAWLTGMTMLLFCSQIGRNKPWKINLKRSDIVCTLLGACGKASKRELVSAPTVVKFDGEQGVDQGGLTRDMWSGFREKLFQYEARARRNPTATIVVCAVTYLHKECTGPN